MTTIVIHCFLKFRTASYDSFNFIFPFKAFQKIPFLPCQKHITLLAMCNRRLNQFIFENFRHFIFYEMTMYIAQAAILCFFLCPKPLLISQEKRKKGTE